MQQTTKVLAVLLLWGGLGGTPASAFDGDSGQGQELFMQRCSVCHGPDGRGNNGMAVDFREEWHRLTKSDVELMQSLRNGLSTPGSSYSAGMMPPQMLNEREMRDVLTYLRATFMQ